jgi:hypothetical protein
MKLSSLPAALEKDPTAARSSSVPDRSRYRIMDLDSSSQETRFWEMSGVSAGRHDHVGIYPEWDLGAA